MRKIFSIIVLSLVFLSTSVYSQPEVSTIITGKVGGFTVYEGWESGNCNLLAAFNVEDRVYVSGDPIDYGEENSYYINNSPNGRALLATLLANYNNLNSTIKFNFFKWQANYSCGKKIVGWLTIE